jgi:hypothetical protein
MINDSDIDSAILSWLTLAYEAVTKAILLQQALLTLTMLVSAPLKMDTYSLP